MKIRTGFVANSSSSSFICAIPKDQKKLKITLEIDLTYSSGRDDVIERKITTEEEAIKFINDYGLSEETAEKINNSLKENYIYILQGSNEDYNPISKLLYNQEGFEEELFKGQNLQKIEMIYE